MSTSEDLKADAEWLREFAEELHLDDFTIESNPDSVEATRLKHIANSLDIAATAMFEPSQLEKRAEEYMADGITRALNDIENGDSGTADFRQLTMLWLIYRLGMGAAAQLFGGKQPLDPEDK